MSGIYLRYGTQPVRGIERMGIMQRLRRSVYAGLTLCGWLAAVSFLPALPAAGQSDLPDGPGKALVERICSNCHGVQVFSDNRATRAHWSAVVDDMVSRGAEGTDEELNQILEYLSKNFGPAKAAGQKVNVNKAGAEEIAKTLAISQESAGAIVQYRAKNGAFKNLEALKSVPGIDSKKIDEKKDSIEF
jgi:competence ComEA-like helix-hairpin-helix protein